MTIDRWLKLGISASWWFLLLWWAWSARGNKPPAAGEPWTTRLTMYWVPLVLAFALVGPGTWYAGSWLKEGMVPHTTAVYATALVFAILGVALACWSRYVLGRNWSSVVQIKQGHELIESGPYRYVRHPIYTGILLAYLGNVLNEGDVRGAIGFAILFASFWRKLRKEEAMLGATFGASYAAYRTRTKALLPGVL